MNNPRHLPRDVSAFWTYPTDQFVLRYLDINEARRRDFARTIKSWASQWRIRKIIGGPTLDQIQEVLAEINPIIESSRRKGHEERDPRGTPFTSAQRLDPYCFKILCRAVYKTLCSHTPMSRDQMEGIFYIIQSTIPDSITQAAEERLLEGLPERHQEGNPIIFPPAPADISMKQLQQIGTNLENIRIRESMERSTHLPGFPGIRIRHNKHA